MINKIGKIIIVIGLYLATSTWVFASGTTYYISPSGNDSTGNGTSGSPWKTLSKACDTVTTSGDTIHINSGTYTESVMCNLSPGVSIEGEGKANTIIKTTLTGTWSTYMQLESPAGTNGNQSISNFTLDGQASTSGNQSGTWFLIFITGRSNVSIHDMGLINSYMSTTIFAGHQTTNGTSWPTGNNIATGNTFYNNEASNCAAVDGMIGGGSGCLMIGAQSGMDIYQNNITTTARPALKNGWPIKYWDNGFLFGVKIHDNTLTKAPYMATYWGEGWDWDFAVEFFNVQGMEFYNNNVQGSVDINYVHKGNYTYGLWAHDNILNHATPNYSHPESGFIFEFKAENIIVENNIVNNAFVGISYNTRAPSNTGGYTYPCGTGGCSANIDNIIRNNIFSNIYQAPYGLSAGIAVISEGTDDPYISNLKIYNNTFIAKATQGSPVGLDFTSQSRGNVNGLYIRNNIFQGFGQSIANQTAQTQSNVVITHNDTYNTPSPTWSGGGVTMDNNLALNPGFISTTDFHLQSSSPLINAGVNVGLPYNGSAPDIGYSESTLSGSNGSGGSSGSGSSGSGSGNSNGNSGGSTNYCPTGTAGVYPNCVSTGDINPPPLPVVTNNPIYFIKPVKINIRSEKNTSSKLVTTLYYRNLVEVLEGNKKSEWIKIKTANGKIGYVRSKYTQALVTAGVNASISQPKLNLRKSETTESPSLRMLKSSNILNVLSISPTTIWAKVKTSDGIIGFVNKFYLIVLP